MESSIMTSFILGLSVMFFWITAWLFYNKGGRLSYIVSSLMTLLGAQCFASLWFILDGSYLDSHCWPIITCIDIVAVPFYALILRELVRPGSVTYGVVATNVVPFLLLAVISIVTGLEPIYWLMISGAGGYGIVYLIWTSINIKKYNRRLKEQYSYTENINLNWLQRILWIFFLLLAIWTIDTVAVHVDIDNLYLFASIVMWMYIDYALYMHRAVIDSLELENECPREVAAETTQLSELGMRIERLFSEERIFLNPDLKISDIAEAVGSNRTYVSSYFNHEASSTFYDYVNGLRVEHACGLLKETDHSVKMIASMSGYNSPQAFIRVFTKLKGVSPSDFRAL